MIVGPPCNELGDKRHPRDMIDMIQPVKSTGVMVADEPTGHMNGVLIIIINGNMNLPTRCRRDVFQVGSGKSLLSLFACSSYEPSLVIRRWGVAHEAFAP